CSAALMQELPQEFVPRLHRLEGAAGYHSLAETFGSPRVRSFRVNRLRSSSGADTLAHLIRDGLTPEPLPWPEGAWSVPSSQRDTLTRHPLVNRGEIYIQYASSQAVVSLLSPHPGQEILHLAAAPVGKTLAVA